MARSRRFIYVFVIITALILTAALCFVSVPQSEGYSDAVSWKVRVTKNSNGKYIDLTSGDTVTDTTRLTFLISDFGSGDNFQYLVSGERISNIGAVTNGWSDFSTSETTIDGVRYRIDEADVINVSKGIRYIYFRRLYTVGGSASASFENYSSFWTLTFNSMISQEFVGFETNSSGEPLITAQYEVNNVRVDYTGGWIGSPLRVTVRTLWMKENGGVFNSSDERLYYSVDGRPAESAGKAWIPMPTNIATINMNLNSAFIDFKVTDVGNRYAAYARYARAVSIDVAEPVFTVSAKTNDLSGNSVDYQNNAWASSAVVFELTDASDCISNITYSVSTDGVEYRNIEQMGTRPDGTAYGIYSVGATVAGLRFRATNQAGNTYDYHSGEQFNVNIDSVIPGATADAMTLDPDDETNYKAISAEFIREENRYVAGYANGQILLRLYNRDTQGRPIINTSGATFYYAVSVDGGEFSQYRAMTSQNADADGNVYFTVTDNMANAVSSKRVYKFYIQSGAGKTSNEIFYEVTLLNSVYSIEVQEITYVPNASGWSATPIPVYVTVPTDSKIIRDVMGNITGYTEPTTQYDFYYAPTNISGALFSAKGAYYSPVENEEGKSVYVFYLSASAESTFTVYARNAAGKRSQNVYTSLNTIKIDTTEPSVETGAYIKSESGSANDERIYISNGEWVNGRIILTLTVKDGVSGVYVRQLAYAVDGNGNIVYDSNGNMVWQETSDTMTPSGTINAGDGSRYSVYTVEIGLFDSTKVFMSEEYRFRVFTGSGVYVDVPFTANIDTTGIVLKEAVFTVGGKTEAVEVNDSEITFGSVCEDGEIELFANEEQNGHFDIYARDGVDGSFIKVEGSNLGIEVPMGTQGVIRKQFYLVSRAKNYLGVCNSTDRNSPYTVIIPYNTKNISIQYELVTDNSVSGTEWANSDLTVRINMVTNEDGEEKVLSNAEKQNYTYYYMRIDYAAGLDLNEAINNGEWTEVADGYYIDDGRYEFVIDFRGKSFYGYVAVAVTNEAGFKSSTSGDIRRIQRIDRTTPKIEDMIVAESGIHEDTSAIGSGFGTITYYSKDDIIITPKNFSNRSTITYYYLRLSEAGDVGGIDAVPDSTNLRGWSRLERDTVLSVPDGSSYAEYYYVFYAVNELGAYAGGINGNSFTQYRFVVDTAKMSGNLTYNANDGGYDDAILGMYAFMWKDRVNITLNINAGTSNTQVMYYYSLDDGKTWEPYCEINSLPKYYPVGTPQTLTFSDDVNSAFTFKAVNKAGSEYIFDKKIYIAIDKATPEFEVETTVGGVLYTGGDTNLSTVSASNWSSLPVTIKINTTKPSVSGIVYTYKITYNTPTGQIDTTEREVPGPEFTTDRLDGFGTNRDALITIIATSVADKNKVRQTPRTFRVKVDQVTPVFTLTGHASDDDSTEAKTISSGEWTNFHRVAVSKANDPNHVNVSQVSYTYTYSDLDSSGVVQNNWPDGNPVFEKTCTIVVTARTEAGLTYSEEFRVNIDTIPPVIKFRSTISVVEGEKHYIDLNVYVEEENIRICEYITTKGDTRGFTLDPSGYVLSTSSVDNSIKYDPSNNNEEYRGYVKIYVEDYAGNIATFELYILPFELDVNNVTLSDVDKRTVDKYEEDLNLAEEYIDPSRVTYFRNLIARLRDRIATLENEIATYQAYLERLAQKTSFELRSDYEEMYEYLETFNNYELTGQKWIQDAIIGDNTSKYHQYFDAMQGQFSRLQKQMDTVNAVEDSVRRLPAINMVVAGDYNDVLRVFDSYNNLNLDQKSCFKSNLYTKLTTLKKRCEIMRLADEITGVSLDADFAPGALIRVESYPAETSYFRNAQTAIMNEKSEEFARAVLSVYRVSLIGVASQSSTGEVTVTLPIPEDYRQYINFAVYTMNANGTLGEVRNMKINGDGRSVTFTNSELTTFILAVKANIQLSSTENESYGTFLGLELDVEMIRNLAIIGASLFAVILIVVIIIGIRHRRFLNSYNRAYKSGIYRRGIQEIPKGNTVPRRNPLKPEERVKKQRKAY